MACEFHVQGGQLPQEELNNYLTRAKERYGREPQRITIKVDGDFVDLDYQFAPQPFERIRRITGYLSVRWTALTTVSAPKSTTA